MPPRSPAPGAKACARPTSRRASPRTRKNASRGLEIKARHARPCAGHPRLCDSNKQKTWMAGTSPATTVALLRLIAFQRDAVHQAAIAVIIVDRIVLGAAIVPERDRARLPMEAAGELRPDLMPEQKIEDRRALLLAHVLEAHRVGDVDVERLAAGLRMGAHRRVLGHVILARLWVFAVLQPIFARARHVGLGGRIERDEPIEQ